MSLATGLHAEDFKERKEDAEKWIEDHFQNFKHDLTSVQEKALERLKNPPSTYDLIDIMKQTGGQLDTLPKDWPNIELYKQDKEHIDAAFEHLSGRIPRTFVYLDVNPSYFELLEDHFFYEDGSLNIANFAELEKKLTYGKFSGYAAVTVSERRNQQDIGNARIKIRLELPNGTNVIPINGDVLAIKGENGFLIEQEFSIITVHNTEYIRIEMKYIDKDSIDEKIIDEQKKFNSNESYREAFGITNHHELFKLLLNDNYASGMIKYIDEALEKMILPLEQGGVEQEYLKDAVRFMEHTNGKIIFTDRLLGFVPEMMGQPNIEIINKGSGISNIKNLCIAINGYTQVEHDNIIVDFREYDQFKKDITHEIGHLLDLRLGCFVYGRREMFSANNDNFNTLFEEAKFKLPENYIFDYAKSNVVEFFAEMFQFIHSDEIFDGKKLSEYIRALLPDVVDFMEIWLKSNGGEDVIPV
ncbi:hypothetical protein BHL53_27030 [Bacillus cereus]|uniref:ADP-ribosyltransferase n=1 Tax=Bacillus cereus TaxID=1396 RepID=UPI000994CC73|nr:ADP-ribosyltransferase [Bacillus cereus]OPA21272.1 hypothetical protein BHL53_27030 [Bacillus cereus]